jgi:chromosome partitioning protein
MKVITVLNEKGGPGKTTVTVNVGAGLAARGHNVLIIDADEQGHATVSFNVRKYPGLYNLLVRSDPDKPAPWGDLLEIVPSSRYGGMGMSRLYLLGSNVETRSIAMSISDGWALAKRLAELSGQLNFDVCLIDTAPTPSLLHSAIYLASDYLLCPTECESLSFDGLAGSVQRVQAVRAMNGAQLRLMGIIPNKYRSSTLEHRENLSDLTSKFGGLVWPAVPQSTLWPEASAYRLPVFVHAPGHDAAGQAWEMVDRVEEVLTHGK